MRDYWGLMMTRGRGRPRRGLGGLGDMGAEVELPIQPADDMVGIGDKTGLVAPPPLEGGWLSSAGQAVQNAIYSQVDEIRGTAAYDAVASGAESGVSFVLSPFSLISDGVSKLEEAYDTAKRYVESGQQMIQVAQAVAPLAVTAAKNVAVGTVVNTVVNPIKSEVEKRIADAAKEKAMAYLPWIIAIAVAIFIVRAKTG